VADLWRVNAESCQDVAEGPSVRIDLLLVRHNLQRPNRVGGHFPSLARGHRAKLHNPESPTGAPFSQ